MPQQIFRQQMADETPIFEFNLGDHGGVIKISSPDELRNWANNELRAWEWLRTSNISGLSEIFQRHQNWHGQLHNYANE